MNIEGFLDVTREDLLMAAVDNRLAIRCEPSSPVTAMETISGHQARMRADRILPAPGPRGSPRDPRPVICTLPCSSTKPTQYGTNHP